jgi:hypothetical protein
MKITRKDFLRLTGLSLLAGGAKELVRAIGPGGSAARAAASQPVRLGMVIDLSKCREKEGCSDCIHACNSAHNIPQIANRAHEVKWIWTEPFGTVCPAVQPLRRPALYARVPHAGDVEARRRHCDDGLASLHRLPLLHCRMPLRIAQLQLGGSVASHHEHQSRFPHAHEGRGGEVQLLRGAAGAGAEAGLR